MISTVNEAKRVRALARYLNTSYKNINVSDYGDGTNLTVGEKEYLVLTDDEANKAAKEYILDSLWAFNSNFLANHTGLPKEVFSVLSEQCESANDAIYKLIEKCGDIDKFVEEAISADGRGHFVSGYDGCENEVGDYFIYRIN